jgi:hypothetical protein
MEKSCYKDIIAEVSKQLSDKIMNSEKNLINRAPMIDGDIRDIVQEIGLQTCQNVLEKTRDLIVEKKNRKG